MNTYAVRGKLALGQQLERGTIVVENNRIASVVRGDVANGNLPEIVYDAGIVSAGMIDLQVNGAIGLEVSASAQAIESISSWMLESGVTGWLPTVVTSPATAYPQVFANWDNVDRSIGATPLGLHLEGPFLSSEKKGAHRADWIDAAADDLLDYWLTQSGIALVTVSAEREGNLKRIRRLVDHGALVSIGHTNSTFEQFEAAVEAGARKATHLFNAMTSIHHREPGAMVAAMLDDRITTGLIPDGVHSHPATLRLALRTKGADRIAIVSDMMAACGHGPGDYTLGGRTVTVSDRAATLADGTLAGSILTMDEAIRNVVAWTDASIGQALHMATAVPATLLGLADRGAIRIGARADLVLWSADLHVEKTLMTTG
ncbi:MAG: N-acetylglucosamine-6-phosphate deacetylase [Thermomicrobiales bacterium]